MCVAVVVLGVGCTDFNRVKEKFCVDFPGRCITVDGIEPATGPSRGGTQVIITGSGFPATVRATIGGMDLVDLVVENSSTIKGKAPAGMSGLADVEVSATGGSVKLAEAFRYVPSSEVDAGVDGGFDAGVDGGFDAGVADAGFDAGVDAGTKRSNGESCQSGDVCGSGNCVDQVCCESACTGQCEACDVSNSRGMCVPVTGAPHSSRPLCNGAGTSCEGQCGGTVRTECTYTASKCGGSSCTAGTEFGEGTCNLGQCSLTKLRDCETHACDGNRCLTVTQVAVGGATVHLSALGGFTCALMSNKTVRCWGANAVGQLGQGVGNLADLHRPTQVPGLSNVISIATSQQAFACALLSDYTVQCWGQNHRGQLGRNVISASISDPNPTPQPVQGVSAASKISLGSVHGCARTLLGGIACWGRNIYGQLGNGDTSSPLPDVPHASDVCWNGTGASCTAVSGMVDLTATITGTCATDVSNIYCWGSNITGLMQEATSVTPYNKPKKLAPTLVTRLMPSSSAQTVGVLVNDTFWGWGQNFSGIFGGAPGSDLLVPTQACADVSCSVNLTNVSQVFIGSWSACAIRDGGVAYCWGRNDEGVLGLGRVGPPDQYYLDAPSIDGGVLDMSVGSSHVCAVLDGGILRCWGADTSGELGDDDTVSKGVPTAPHW